MQLEQPGAPVIAVKARKDLELALNALATGKTAEAGPHVRDALKHAPDNPDVRFIAGTYAERTKDFAEAQKEYEAAIAVFPTHFAAQLALGNLLLVQRDAPNAMPHLEKALAVGPNSWKAHYLLAEAYLRSDEKDVDKIKFHANRAIELGKGKATGARSHWRWPTRWPATGTPLARSSINSSRTIPRIPASHGPRRAWRCWR